LIAFSNHNYNDDDDDDDDGDNNRKNASPCSSLSTARGTCLCYISWIQANWFKQYRAQKSRKKLIWPWLLTYDLWPWYSIGF